MLDSSIIINLLITHIFIILISFLVGYCGWIIYTIGLFVSWWINDRQFSKSNSLEINENFDSCICQGKLNYVIENDLDGVYIVQNWQKMRSCLPYVGLYQKYMRSIPSWQKHAKEIARIFLFITILFIAVIVAAKFLSFEGFKVALSGGNINTNMLLNLYIFVLLLISINRIMLIAIDIIHKQYSEETGRLDWLFLFEDGYILSNDLKKAYIKLVKWVVIAAISMLMFFMVNVG